MGNPFHVDGIYDYGIPMELETSVVPGALVIVPFGTANRPQYGLVESVSDTCRYAEVKQIHSVCPDNLFLDEEMLGLCKFLKSRTLCTTGDAVHTMIPAAALSRIAEWYSVTPEHPLDTSGESNSSDLFVYDYAAYRYVFEHGEVSLPQMQKQMGVRGEASLRRLWRKGYLNRRILYKNEKEGKLQKLYSLSWNADRLHRLLLGEKIEGIRLTSQKHKSILSVLEETGEPMSSADILAQAGATQPQLKALVEKGIVACEEVSFNRNPYEEAPFVGRKVLTLNEEQEAGLNTLWSLADSGKPKGALLYGITGSGKTSVMVALMDKLLDAGKGVILLLPEIALTPQSVAIFCSRYGNRVAVIHSALSAGERYDAYCRIRRGEADVVIGTRSAVFAPVKNLGAIIIDEEQEHTYKSDQDPKYRTKDVARYRCSFHNALMLLASATPSVESFQKAQEGIYTLVKLTHRYGNARLPETETVDMREEMREGNTSLISRKLEQRLRQTLEKGEQSILFLNRRGYNRIISCRACGEPLTCPRCSVAMTYHTARGNYREGEMICHWCGYRMPVPRLCPSCSSDRLAHMGYGTQRVEEELKILFPEAKILRMDADTVTGKMSYEALLKQFREKQADILLGTQMVTKGHDFPKVTLVGILLADLSLYLGDYRAAERTYGLLTQVIGRAGRSDLPGRAVIQTVNPYHEIIKLSEKQDYDAFFAREMKYRREFCFPPICDIALLSLSSPREGDLKQAAKKLSEELESLQKNDFPAVELLTFGPFEEPVYRVDNRYRMRTVVKCKLTKETYLLFATLLSKISAVCGRWVKLSVDFNPSNL